MRRFATLIELLIALVLTAALMGILNAAFYQVSMWEKHAEEKAEEGFIKRRLLSRLSEVVPRILKSRFSYTKEGGLLFNFDNGVQMDPLFSNEVIGRLFLSDEEELVLAMWPEKKRWKKEREPEMKKEVLLEEVESLSFQFYSPELGVWKEFWDEEELKLPPLVKILIKKEGREQSFAFPLNHTEARIILQ